MSVWRAGQAVFPLDGTGYVMGILNVTPDSFSDGGQFQQAGQALAHALQMERDGAALIDAGAQSTRPGFTAVPPEEEWRRLAPVLEALRGSLRVPFSVDTFYPEVARRALEAGASAINDVTGFRDPAMRRLAAESGCGCIVMHNGACHDAGREHWDVLDRVRAFFSEVLEQMERDGIPRERICADPGVGFGKTQRENLALLAQVDRIKPPGCAFLMAASRKRVIGAACGNPPPAERMPGTLAAHTLAQAGGADFLRAHDVKEAVQAARVASAVLRLRRGVEANADGDPCG